MSGIVQAARGHRHIIPKHRNTRVLPLFRAGFYVSQHLVSSQLSQDSERLSLYLEQNLISRGVRLIIDRQKCPVLPEEAIF